MDYEIKGLNVFNVLRYISGSKELIDPTAIPTHIVAGLDEETSVLFCFKDSRTVTVSIMSNELSGAAEERFLKFCKEVENLGFKVSVVENIDN